MKGCVPALKPVGSSAAAAFPFAFSLIDICRFATNINPLTSSPQS
jgi:hypothetical protein